MPQHNHNFEEEKEFSYKSLLFPLTTLKAITWIVIIGFFVFCNALWNGFVWDDIVQIVNGNAIHSIFNLPLFYSQNNFLAGAFYRPIQLSYIALLYTLFGSHAFFFHLSQIVLHIVNTILLFYLFKKFFPKYLSFFLSLIFLVHPLVVESVVYVSASSEVLCTFFGLLALLQISKKQITNRTVFLSYLFLLVSLLSKETGIIFVLLTLMYQFVNNMQIQKNQYGYLGSLIGIYLFFRFGVAHVVYKNLPFVPIMNSSFAERLIMIPKIVAFYLLTIVFPKDLAISQHWLVSTISFANFVLPLLFVILIFSLFFFLGRWIHTHQKKYVPLFLFFAVWFVSGLILCLQIIPLTMTVADRWLYVPFIGFLGMIGVGLYMVPAKMFRNRTLIIVVGCLVLAILSLRTMIRNTNWYDPLTLYSHDIVLSKDSFFLANDLGNEYLQRQQYEKAQTYFQQSATIYPYEVNLYNLGLTYAKENNSKRADYYFKQAVDHYQGYIGVTALARLLLINNDLEDTRTLLQKGLAQNPNDVTLLLDLAVIDYKLGDQQSALAIAQKVYAVYPTTQTKYIFDQISNKLPLE